MKIRYRKTHALMLLLIVIWSIDVVTISMALEAVNQVFLLCAKYICALPVVAAIVAMRGGFHLPEGRDLPLLFLSMLLGDVFYFFFEYTALKHLAASTVTILLGFLPAMSYLTDCAVERRKPAVRTMITILISIAGLTLVVLEDQVALNGEWTGYACCVVCIAIWIGYGYLTRRLDETYSSSALALYQMIMAILVMLPIAAVHVPDTLSDRDLWIGIVLMGMLSSGAGCIIEIKGLIDLGTTITGIYLNLLPVLTAIAGMIFLHERMTLLQGVWAVMVIVCGILVEYQTERMNNGMDSAK